MENEKAIDNDQAQSTVDTFIQKKKCKKVSVQKFSKNDQSLKIKEIILILA
jgi:hypothetical protein